jgi:competence protein ComEC
MLLSYYRRPLFLLLLVYSGGIFVFRNRLLTPEPLPFALPRAGAVAAGRIAEYPVLVPGGVRFALEASSFYGRPAAAGLMVYAKPGAYSYGDTVELFGDLELPPGASVPGSLDWADFLARRGIAAQLRAREVEVKRRAGPLLLLARRARESALASFRAALPQEGAAVLGGVVLGEKKSVPPELKAAFQDSGAMHLLVASGSNVGFVVAVVYFLCSRLGLGRRYSGGAALALAGFYVLAAGLDAPLVRAYLMFAAGLLAWLLRRESGAFQALAAAALLILLLEPRALFDAGFQMSFLAAYGLTVGLALWGKYLKPGGPAGALLGVLAVSFFAQLCLYPVLAVYFHKISLVSLLSNMALVPASGVAMGLGFGLALSGGVLFSALAAAAGLFMDAFLWTVRFFAGLPFASISVAQPSAWFVAGFFLLALALLHAPLLGFRRRRLYLAAGLGLGVASAGAFGGAAPDAPRRYQAQLFGDSDTAAALVSAPGGLFLVNPGVNGRKAADSVLTAGRASLEAVLLTSLEEKNFSGLEELGRLVKVKLLLLPCGPRPPELARALAALEKGGTQVRRLWPGEQAVAGEKISAAWGGTGPGYTGAGDILEWEIGAVTVSDGGLRAENTAPCGPTEAGAEAQAWKTVALEFELPPGGCR